MNSPMQRHPKAILSPKQAETLKAQADEYTTIRIAQITDPHLGPFMSVARLRSIIENLLEHEPDIVFLTGDYTTKDARGHPWWLETALEPLQSLAIEGRVFACLGNHDYEDLNTIKTALANSKIPLLVDQHQDISITPRHHPDKTVKIQVIGARFGFNRANRSQSLQKLYATIPIQEHSLRVLMLHDPSSFVHLPMNQTHLVLSGHTHGGQIGLVSLGLNRTLLSTLRPKFPDHGVWTRGYDTLYIHRGTGHYGYPFRLGVPNEQSILDVVVHNDLFQ